jgi:hypothetical protein
MTTYQQSSDEAMLILAEANGLIKVYTFNGESYYDATPESGNRGLFFTEAQCVECSYEWHQ